MPRILTRLAPLLLACALPLTGCDTAPTRATPDPAQAAERDFAAGEFSRAAEGFLEAADWNRGQRDALRLRAAEAWREEGDLERAGKALEGVSGRRFDADARERLLLLRTEVALSQSDAPRALGFLEELGPQVTEPRRTRRLELAARAEEADGNLFQAAAVRAELTSLLPRTEVRANTRAIQDLLARADDAALAFGAASLKADHPLYPHAARALTERGLPLPHPIAMPAQSAADGYHPYGRIALLLPLGSNIDAAAQAVRDGFLAGYLEETRSRPQVRIYATANSAESALAAWEAARKDGVQAIVGPLGREEVEAVFEADRDGSLPMLALNRGTAAPPPSGSLSFALNPEDEGVAAAKRILRRAGKRVLVVQGGDEYGQRAASALAHRLEQREGRVVATLSLPADSPDYGPAIAAVLPKLDARAVASEGDLRVEENRLALNVDAIFFTGRASQARLLVPQLRVAGIYDLPIYATSQITAGADNARLDRELDGIEFTDSPWLLGAVAGTPARESLGGLDTARGGAARLFAFGMDAFRLIGHLDQLGRDPRASLAGATGTLRSDGLGQVVRTPAWARFRGGRILPAGEEGLIGDELQFDQP